MARKSGNLFTFRNLFFSGSDIDDCSQKGEKRRKKVIFCYNSLEAVYNI